MNLTLAILAGFFSSLGSVCSKMPSLFELEKEIYSHMSLCLTIFSVGSMVVCNASGLFLYTKSLQQTDSTIVSTITSTASNYIISGFFGVILYGETLTMMWLVGTAFVIVGLILISTDQSNESVIPKTD